MRVDGTVIVFVVGVGLALLALGAQLWWPLVLGMTMMLGALVDMGRKRRRS